MLILMIISKSLCSTMAKISKNNIKFITKPTENHKAKDQEDKRAHLIN